jgi:hypothetical protein
MPYYAVRAVVKSLPSRVERLIRVRNACHGETLTAGVMKKGTVNEETFGANRGGGLADVDRPCRGSEPNAAQ